MKKSVILLTLLFITMLSFAQTSNETIQLKKHRGNIVNAATNEVIPNSELKKMLDEDSYYDYIRGKRQRIGSIPLWGSTAACAAVSASCFIISHNLIDDCNANHNHNHEFEEGAFCNNGALAYWLIGGFFAAGTVIYAVPSTILTISSCRNINNAVDSYNKKTTDMTLGFGATNNGIGLTLKF